MIVASKFSVVGESDTGPWRSPRRPSQRVPRLEQGAESAGARPCGARRGCQDNRRCRRGYTHRLGYGITLSAATCHSLERARLAVKSCDFATMTDSNSPKLGIGIGTARCVTAEGRLARQGLLHRDPGS